MLTLPEIARSRYLLNAALSDVFGPLKAVLAVEVLLGPEPDQDDDVIGEPLEWHPERLAKSEPGREDWEEAALIFDRMELPPWPAEYPAVFTEADARAAGLAV